MFVPPSLTTISEPEGVTALRTATRCLYPVGVENVTLTTGAPNDSTCPIRPVVWTTFPSAERERRPPKVNASLRGLGNALNDVVGRLHGSGAISTGGRLSMPLGMPLRKRSNHARTSRAV